MGFRRSTKQILYTVFHLVCTQLDSDAFSILHINEHNYNEVDNITLDDNKLDELPGKLLDMKLKLSFSARNNQLTSVSIAGSSVPDSTFQSGHMTHHFRSPMTFRSDSWSRPVSFSCPTILGVVPAAAESPTW